MNFAVETKGLLPSQDVAASSLLSLVDSSTMVRPLRVWRADQCAFVQAYFRQRALDWQRDWGLCCATKSLDSPAATASSVRSKGPSSFAGDREQYLQDARCFTWAYVAGADSSPVSWCASVHRGMATDEQLQAPLAALYADMFGEACPQFSTALLTDSLALEMCMAAWADWWRRLEFDLAVLQEPAPSGSAPDPWWSGSLQVHLPWCAGMLVIELNLEQTTSLLSVHAPDLLSSAAPDKNVSAPKMVNLVDAIGQRELPLRAMLHGVELSLRQIQSLRIGDVVPLEHRLDEPTSLETADAFVVCQGWLGQQSGHVAVAMVSRTTLPEKD